MGCKGCCQDEFKRSNFGLTHEKPELFVRSQWKIYPGFYIAWRVLSWLFLLVWLIYSAFPDPGPWWFIYLTNWSFFLLTLSAFIQAVIAIGAYIKQKKSKHDEVLFAGMPWFLKVEWVLYNISSGVALVVTLAYWTLIFPAHNTPISLVGFTTHGWNSIYVVIDLFITAIPIRVYHLYHAILYAVVYGVFSVIYEFASGEEYIYAVLDWSESPGWAALYLMLIILVVTPILWMLLYILYRIRRAIFTTLTQDKDTKTGQVV